ncbi:MAG: hypothetical protein MJ069_04540 [Salinivirgaceae bacterium]|nr:hypothetical protein [Salinivirgaceae bacterium]
MKQTKGTGNIEKKARYAINHQKAEIVLQCLERGIDTDKAINALYNLWHIDKIKVYYYFDDGYNVIKTNSSLTKKA